MGGMVAERLVLGLLAVVLLASAAYSLTTGRTYLAQSKGLGTPVAAERADSPGQLWVSFALSLGSLAVGIMSLLGAAGVFYRWP